MDGLDFRHGLETGVREENSFVKSKVARDEECYRHRGRKPKLYQNDVVILSEKTLKYKSLRRLEVDLL